MNIWIETPVEGTIMLDVDPSDTIGSIRQQLHGLVTIPPHLYIQALMLKDIHLNDALSVERHELVEDTTLSMYLARRLSPNV